MQRLIKQGVAVLLAVSFVLLLRMYATLPDIYHRMPLFPVPSCRRQRSYRMRKHT